MADLKVAVVKECIAGARVQHPPQSCNTHQSCAQEHFKRTFVSLHDEVLAAFRTLAEDK